MCIIDIRVGPAGCPARPPTDPDVNNSLIRFLGSRSADTTPAHNCAALQAPQSGWRILGLGSGNFAHNL